MSKTWVPTVLVISTLFTLAAYCGLEIIPERAQVLYMNTKYFYNYSINVKRYSRASPYLVNMEMTTKQAWNNNVTVNIIFNEYLHNEYRRSFIELHYKFCDFINLDKFLGPILVFIGISCPMPAGPLRLRNFSFGMENFPNVFPFEKTRLDVELTITATNETMAKTWQGNELNPEDWGCKLINSTLEPIRTLLPPAPEKLLNTIFCNCKKGCSAKCECKKVGLQCSPACTNCQGVSCLNVQLNTREEDSCDFDDTDPSSFEQFLSVHQLEGEEELEENIIVEVEYEDYESD